MPNLTPPTPFVLTPAASPCPSPGPSFGAFPGFATGLPNLSTTKPKPKDKDDKLKVARDERKRLADYELKPRFEFAFGSWGVESVFWSFDGMSILQGLTDKRPLLCRGSQDHHDPPL